MPNAPIGLELLEPRRLLSAAAADVLGPRVVEHDPVAGTTRVLEPGEATGDLAALEASLGEGGLAGLLASLGSPDEFTDRIDAMLDGPSDGLAASKAGGGLAGGFRSVPGFNPTGASITPPGSDRSVEPPDDRSRVDDTLEFPFSAVGRLSAGCSGAMIGPFHFLTAGHCVTGSNGFDPLSSMSVSLGQDGDTRPFGTANATFVRTYDEWLNGGDWEHDWALVTLDRRLGDFAGHFGYRAYQGSNALAGKDVTILQYPGDKPFGTQWQADGQVGYSTARKVFYNGTLDTAGGSSGSSVWELLPTDTAPAVLGVHGYGGAGGGGGFNSASRITDRKFDDLNLWQATDEAVRPPQDKADLVSLASVFADQGGVAFPAAAPAGGQVAVEVALRNLGTLAAQDVDVDVYLAPAGSGFNSPSAVLLGRVNVGELSPFENATTTLYAKVPAGLADGNYTVGWVADPQGEIAEFVESNNTAVVGTLAVGVNPAAGGGSSGGGVDAYEPNDSLATATDLGRLGELDLTGLSIHSSTDEDYFTFAADQSGVARIDVRFTDAFGDIDVRVTDEFGDTLDTGFSASDDEFLIWSAQANARYTLQVFGWQGATNDYLVEFDLPGNAQAGVPAFESADYGYQAAQQVSFAFDRPLAEVPSVADLTLQNLTTGATVSPGDLRLAVGNGAATWLWAGAGLLPDGNYRATLPAAAYGGTEDASHDFFVLAGDFNRDRVVNTSDLLNLLGNFGASPRIFATGDANRNGVVNTQDLLVLLGAFGTTLPPLGGGSSLFGDE